MRFIIANDPAGSFAFAALQSTVAATMLAPFGGASAGRTSVIVLDADGLHTGSSAALRIARKLRGRWRWLAYLEVIPVGVRDPVYFWIARNRYRWFGRRTVCMTPTAAQRSWFIDEPPAAATPREL